MLSNLHKEYASKIYLHLINSYRGNRVTRDNPIHIDKLLEIYNGEKFNWKLTKEELKAILNHIHAIVPLYIEGDWYSYNPSERGEKMNQIVDLFGVK